MGKYSNEFKSQVVEYYKTHTAKETAQKFSVPVNTIQSLGRNMGFAKGNDKYPVDFKHEACQFYETHTGSETIAKFGVTIAALCQWRKDLGYRNKHRGYNLYTEALQPNVTKRERRNFVMTRSENGKLKAELQQRDERINSLEARLTQLEDTSNIISRLKQLLN
jgi:transposase-like protein